MSRKKSSLLINDLVEELSAENNRLLNELSIAQNLIKLLVDFKTFVDLNSDELKLKDYQNYDELNQKLSIISVKFQNSIENNCKDNENNVIKSEELDNWSDGMSEDNNDSDFEAENKEPEKKYECDICHKNFAFKSGLCRHRKKHSVGEEKTYLCERYDCDYKTTSAKDLRIHKKDHPKSTICEFPGCDKTYKNSEQLARHQRRCHLEYEEMCVCDVDGCGKQFANNYRLREHFNRSHRIYDKLFICEHQGCGKQFSNGIQLRKHDKRVHRMSDPSDRLVCDFQGCDKTYKNSENLRQHRQRCHLSAGEDRHRFCCDHPGCDYRAVNRFCVLKHMAYRHSAERPFVCPTKDCEKAFSDKYNLQKHVRTVHNATKSFQCEWPGCEFRTVHSKSLKEHSVIHTQQRFHCDVEGCGKSFTSQSYVRKHKLNVHRMGVELSCLWPGCDFTTLYAGSMRKHEVYHQTGGQYVCHWPGCGKRVNHKHSLVEHINTIHKNYKKYVCSVMGCLYRTAVTSNLKKHMKKHNK